MMVAMTDSFTEVTNTGYGSRIKGAIVGGLVGIICIPLSFILLWMNEENSARSHAGLSELSRLAVTVPADQVDAGNEGKPVHLTGNAVTEEVLKDELFQVSAMSMVHFLFVFIAGNFYFFSINYDDVITNIIMWGILRLVFSH